MRVLVTGAAGFIGQHVCKLLKEGGHEVIGLDNTHSSPVYLDIGADVTETLPVLKHLDAVIHLAAIASPRECDADPAKAYLVNVHGTRNVLEMARKSGAHKFVFSSSAHVYGVPPRRLPTGEDSE